MAKDFYHENMREALEKDGWRITHDPYPLKVDDVGYEIDFGAEPLIGAEKEGMTIAVEVKSFVGPSTVNEFHKAVGQFNDYYVALEIKDPNRVLFLAIPRTIWLRFFQKPLIQKSLARVQAKIIVYNPSKNEIVEWIK
jgi:XisH protein